MIRWAKWILLLLGLCCAAFYAYEAWVIAELFKISWRSYTVEDFLRIAVVGLGPAVLAGALLATNWPSAGTNGRGRDDVTDVIDRKHARQPDIAHTEVRAKPNIPGRIWLGFLVVLTLVSGHSPNDPPVDFADAARPTPPWAPTVADLLDKIGNVVGRAWCWMEAKLGLRPKTWPAAPD